MQRCCQCGAPLSQEDIGCTRKLINRGCTEFYCIPCLAKRLGVTEALLRTKIEEWRSYGCMLFPEKS